MAEGALLFLMIGKITGALAQESVRRASSLVAEEITLLVQVRSRMSQIKSEFEVIQAFLSYTEAWKDNDPVLEAWVKQVREVAFDVEDTMDEYTHLLGRRDQEKKPRWFLPKNKALRHSGILRSWHGVAKQLEEILNRLHHLRDMKDRYGIETHKGSDRSGSSGERRKNLAEDAHFIDNNEIVGFEEERKILMQLLTEGEKRRTIISVWGMAGLGKTTLVTDVYKSKIKRRFSRHAWISVSQNYSTDDLLRRIIKELLKGKEEGPASGVIDTMEHRGLVETLRDNLKEQRYIIILDDVWSPTVWTDISAALEDGNCGSRVVLTTRIHSVASLAAETRIVELKPLSEEEALKLFHRKALHSDQAKEHPEELQRLSKKIVHKCRYLPLAIVAVGSLLSLRNKEESEWNKVLRGLDWELNNNPELDQVKSALALSYRVLPNFLKHCFLYCSMFPKHYPIRRNMLFRLWIAEGFIQRRGKQTLEDIAENNLNELVYRCMLQVVERNDFGRIKSCRMHDIMRDVVLSLSEREGFSHIYEHSRRLQGKVRRLSVHRCGEQNEMRNVSMPHVRSLVLFGQVKLPFRSFKLLRVLDLQGLPLKSLPDAMWDLFNLHYLGLRKTEVKTIPSLLERLSYLETLDLAYTKIKKLPNGLTKLKHLRNLFVHTIRDPTFKSYNYLSGFPAPRGIWNLENLNTLQGVEADKEMAEHLEDMVQLRSFRIIMVRAAHHAKLCTALKKMERLHKLDIVAATEDEKDALALGDLSPPPPSLQKLTLRGQLRGRELPGWFNSLTNLKWLRLCWSGLEKDPLPSLQALPNLVFLLLLRAFTGTVLCFGEGFEKLRDLRLVDMTNLGRVRIEEGALPNLCQLNLVRCRKLKEVPQGIEYLSKLEALYLEEMPAKLVDGLKHESRIQHIPSRNIFQTDGIWSGESIMSTSLTPSLQNKSSATTVGPHSKKQRGRRRQGDWQ